MHQFFSWPGRKAQGKPARTRCVRPQVEALEDRLCLSPGAMEWSDPIPTVAAATGVYIQPWDSKMVVAGYGNGSGGTVMDLVRYNADGSLDGTFGSGGVVVSKFNTNGWSAAALYSSTDTTGNAKKIVEAGSSSLARFNANGTVDTSFGKKGLVTVASTSNIVGVVIQPADGKIVIAGNTSGVNFVLTRYNPDGTLDKTFGSGGTATLTAQGVPGGPVLEGLVLQADGKFVVGGEGSWPSTLLALARITPNGALDTTFGGGSGYLTTSFGTNDISHIRLALYPTTGPDTADAGKIEAAATITGNPGGINSNQIAVARFNADGSPDSAFGQAGQVVTPFPTGGGMAWATAVQGDGKIIVAGQTITAAAGGWWFSLLRYNRDGSLDATFGSGGLVQTTIGSAPSLAKGVTIQPDGRIVAVGTINNELMIARYLAGPEIGTFTASASTVTSGGNLTLTAANLSDGDPSGSGYATITQVAFYAVDQSGNRHLLGYGTNSGGTWTLSGTIGLATGSYTLLAEATDSTGVIGDSSFLSLTVQ
jgi:uncharacterized delta-60 repeat protein